MIARIVRLEQTDQGALGVLLLDGLIFCYTLEPDNKEKDRFYIPAGLYKCKRFHGSKWKNTFEIICPPHTALLFHSGNIETDSLGCVLLGSTTGKLKGKRAVLNSGVTFQQFLDFTKYVNEFNLIIEDRYF